MFPLRKLFISKKIRGNIRTKTNLLNPRKLIYGQGDEVVLTSSSLIAALKWAWEFDTQQSTDPQTKPKPVKIVEVCSSYNTRVSIWDKPGAFEKNEYVGALCECTPEKSKISGEDCKHSTVQNDKGFLQVLGMVLNTKEQYNNTFTKLTSEELEILSSMCPQLRAPPSSTTFLKSGGGLDYTAL
jgi:hypothetical protein